MSDPGPLQQRLIEVEARLQDVDAELRRQSEVTAGLQAERAGLVIMKDRLLQSLGEGPPTSPPPTMHPPDPGNLAPLPRTEAILRVVNDSDLPLSIQSIVDELERRGRTEERYEVVAATLQLLLRTGRVRRIDRGRYAAA